jgi:hypothetical protein
MFLLDKPSELCSYKMPAFMCFLSCHDIIVCFCMHETLTLLLRLVVGAEIEIEIESFWWKVLWVRMGLSIDIYIHTKKLKLLHSFKF